MAKGSNGTRLQGSGGANTSSKLEQAQNQAKQALKNGDEESYNIANAKYQLYTQMQNLKDVENGLFGDMTKEQLDQQRRFYNGRIEEARENLRTIEKDSINKELNELRPSFSARGSNSESYSTKLNKDGSISVSIQDRGKAIKEEVEKIAKKYGFSAELDKNNSDSFSVAYILKKRAKE